MRLEPLIAGADLVDSSTTATTRTDIRSRKGKHNAIAALSDDEGTYQALSVVFEDTSKL